MLVLRQLLEIGLRTISLKAPSPSKSFCTRSILLRNVRGARKFKLMFSETPDKKVIHIMHLFYI